MLQRFGRSPDFDNPIRKRDHAWIASAIVATLLTVNTGVAVAETITLRCSYTNVKHEPVLFEIDEAKVVADGRRINADNVTITDRYISFDLTTTAAQMTGHTRIDRMTGAMADEIVTMKPKFDSVVQTAQCEKIESTPKKF